MPCQKTRLLQRHRSGWRVTLLLAMLATVAPVFVQAQDAGILGNSFYSTTITAHDESHPQIVIFFDYNDNFVVQGAPVIDLISKAYDTSPYLIVDGPDWIYTPHLYDIKAVPPPEFFKSDREKMIINLLADRFRLQAQPATREIDGLALELKGDSPPFEHVSDEPGPGIRFLSKPQPSGNRHIRVTFSFADLVPILSRELNQAVIDRTGLTGTYELELTDYAPVIPQIKFSDLLDEFGLVLRPGRTTTDVLAITHIERPALDD